METLNLNVRVDASDKKGFECVCKGKKVTIEVRTSNFDETIYNKLREAELEINNTDKRYSKKL